MAISDYDMRNLREMWRRTKGEAWEPQNPKHELLDRLIAAGYLKRVDGRCGFEAFKDAMIAWTEAGRAAMQVEPVSQ
jgi:hypothetical protein